jgi:hypothetical protein
MTARSSRSTTLWAGFLWMRGAVRRGSVGSLSHPRSVPRFSNLPATVDPAGGARTPVFPRFSQPYCYGFEDSTLRFYALAFLPAVPRTHP